MEFQISAKAKKVIFGLVGVGLALFLIGIFTDGSDQKTTRIQYATETGWSVAIKRVVEGVASYVLLGAGIVVAIFLALTFTDGGYTDFHGHHLGHIYQYFDSEMVESDKILKNKSAFLNKGFFWGATIVYIAIYTLFYLGFRKRSLREDIEGGTKIHFKNFAKAALFLVLFGYSSSTLSWHWLMSIDAHWFSTLYGWYVFSGMWLTAMVSIMLLVLYLKKLGHLTIVNDSHIHDIGKWIFALSFLWSYLFFSQFMLYWYSNIGEEVIYYRFRFDNYKFIFWGMFAVNFIIPMLILMSREAKRHIGILVTVCFIIIIGHWVDMFMLVTPGSMGEFGKIGMVEIGLFMLFAGVFAYWVLNTLTKAPLVPKNHPYLDESKHHDI